MATRLTKKEKGFVKAIVKGSNGVEAALANYDTESYSTAGVIASENLKKPKIVNAIEEALPDELLDTVHREGLFASKPFFNDNGELIAEEADFNVRAKYLDMAYKRKGSYAPDKTVNVNVGIEASDKIKELAQKLRDLDHGNILQKGQSDK